MFGRSNLPDLNPSRDILAFVREMERNLNHLYRDFNRSWTIPHALPHSATSEAGNMFRLNVDMAGFKPDDIKGLSCVLCCLSYTVFCSRIHDYTFCNALKFASVQLLQYFNGCAFYNRWLHVQLIVCIILFVKLILCCSFSERQTLDNSSKDGSEK